MTTTIGDADGVAVELSPKEVAAADVTKAPLGFS
jgi:hypothetical protein